MDRSDLEPNGRLLQDLARLQELLCGNHGAALARHGHARLDGIKRQCDAADVAFFFKQWGTWSADGEKRSKAANGREYRGQVWDAMPQLA